MVGKLIGVAGLLTALLIVPRPADAADEFSAAAGYYQSGQWEAAIAVWDSFLVDFPQDPRRPEATYFRCEALVQLGKLNEADAGFGRFLSEYSGHRLAARARYRRAENLFLQERWVAAARAFREFHAQHPYHELCEYSLVYLGIALNETGDVDEAATALNQSLRRFPSGQRAFAARRVLIELAARAHDAKTMQTHLAALRPGTLATSNGPQLSPAQRDQWHYWEGLRQRMEKNPLAARKAFQAVATKDQPELASAVLAQLAEVEHELGNDAAAKEAARQLVARWPERAVAKTALIRMIEWDFEAAEFDSALTLCEEYKRRYHDPRGTSDVTRWQAQIHIKRHDDEAAIELLTELSRSKAWDAMSPIERSVTWYHLGIAYQQAGQQRKALEILNRIRLESLDVEFQGRVILARASTRESLGEYEVALQELSKAADLELASDAFRSRCRYRQVSILLRQGQLDEALANLTQWQPTSDDGWYARSAASIASNATSQGRHRDAEIAYRLALQHFGATKPVLTGLIHALLEQGQLADAGDALDRLQQRFPDARETAQATTTYARACQDQNAAAHALDAYRQLFRSSTKALEYWQDTLFAARLMTDEGFQQESLELLERAEATVADDLGRRQLQYQRAWVLRSLGRREDAHQLFRTLYEAQSIDHHDPIWQDVTYRLALKAFHEGHREASEMLVAELVESMIGTPESKLRPYVLYLRAQLSARAGDWQSALTKLDQLLADSGSELHVAANILSSEALFRLGDYENALFRLESLLGRDRKLEPSQTDWIRVRIAQILGTQGRWEEAIDIARTVIDHQGENKWVADAYLVAGRGLVALGAPQDGIQLMVQVAGNEQALPSTKAAARWYLADVYFEAEKYEIAIREFGKIKQADSEEWYARALLRLGKSYERTGRFELARNAYQKVVSMQQALAGSATYGADARQRLRMLAAEQQPGTQEAQLPVAIERDQGRSEIDEEAAETEANEGGAADE